MGLRGVGYWAKPEVGIGLLEFGIVEIFGYRELQPELPKLISGFPTCYPRFPIGFRDSGFSGSGSGFSDSEFGFRVLCPV